MHSIKNKLQNEGLRIVKLLQQNGFKAFWVGGTVRSLVLNQPIDNLDIATSAHPEETERILNEKGFSTKPVGKAYGTILAAIKSGPIEITTFRREGKYIYRRRPEKVTYIDDYLEDSLRRDFTINAMYYNPVTKELFDPQGGQKDIARKLLRFVGDPRKRIDEDALRMLRGVRFYTELGFKIEKNSHAAIKTRAKYITQISGERVKQELDGILKSENRVQGFKMLDKLGLLRFIMPEVSSLKNVWHKSKHYHLEGSVFMHSLMTLENIKSGNHLLAYAALFHDSGKGQTAVPRKKEEGIVNSFPNHENVSADLFGEFSKRIKMGRKESDLVLWITKMHMKRISFTKDMSEDKKIQLASHKYFPELIELWRADALSNLRKSDENIIPGIPIAYTEGMKMLAIIKSKKKLIEILTDGDLIMKYAKISSGPAVGKIKNVIRLKILSNEIKNKDDVKIFLRYFIKNT